MVLKVFFVAAGLAGLTVASASAQEFRLTRASVAEGAKLTEAQVFTGFGCDGGNRSPDLSWSNTPKGTKSFAITAYDPDAPTGSGWWHWDVVNIPASVSDIKAGASDTAALPSGSVEIRNDYGTAGFGGVCPPPGEVHRYIFTVHALGVERLDLPQDASNALAGFMIRANTIGRATITAVYNR